MVRINKFLSQCNLGSRRFVENLIKDGKIFLNGNRVEKLSVNIDPDKDIVKYNGFVVSPFIDKIYLMLNKPKKYLVSSKDDFGRKTVFDLIPDFKTHLFAVGRLDYMSEGLLLLTNDGDYANRIIHPRNKLPKLYRVVAKGILNFEQVRKLRDGVMIEGKKTKPAVVFVKKNYNDKTNLKITIFEGRKRQIRKMLKSVGSEVLELKRLQIGNLKLGKLPVGMWRWLLPNEVVKLQTFRNKI
jgi:23S rRNA pseudouridine2605 synthase